MKQGLFESLTGRFIDGTPVDSESEKAGRTHSIMDHLNRIFNTREGSNAHLVAYGLPDISEVYRRMPNGVVELQNSIKKTIELYEPRLHNVKVIRKGSEGEPFKLIFIISAELRGGEQVRFQTSFTDTGNSSIGHWKKPD